MKKFRHIVFLFTALLLVINLTACNSLEDISSVLDEALPATVKDGKDYIEYVNTDRLSVIEPYIGDKLSSDEATILLDNVEFYYYEKDETTNEFEVGVENKNANYYFDGTILLKNDENEYKMNVHMLPPESEVYFYLGIEGDFEDYEYFVEGDVYKTKDEIICPVTYMYYETSDPNEYFVVIDEPEITEKIVEEFADYTYLTDTLYNYFPLKCYLVSKDKFDENDYSIYDYELYVDASAKTAVAEDINGDNVLDKDYSSK